MESKTITVDRARWDRIVAVVLAIEPTSDPIGWLETRDQLPTWIRDWAMSVDVALEHLQLGDLDPVSPPTPDAGMRERLARMYFEKTVYPHCLDAAYESWDWCLANEPYRVNLAYDLADAVIRAIREGQL